MADHVMTHVLTLKDEERRRQLTVLALLGGLLVSTLPVTNERALFSPFADQAPLQGFLPTAYAMVTGFGPLGLLPFGGYGGPGGGYGGPAGGYGVPGVPNAAGVPLAAGQPPAAYGAILPPAGGFGGPPAAAGGPFGGAGGPADGGPMDLIPPFGYAAIPGGGFGGPFLFGPGTGTGGTIGDTPAETTPVPEPSTWTAMLLGIAIMGAALRSYGRRLTGRRGSGSVSAG